LAGNFPLLLFLSVVNLVTAAELGKRAGLAGLYPEMFSCTASGSSVAVLGLLLVLGLVLGLVALTKWILGLISKKTSAFNPVFWSVLISYGVAYPLFIWVLFLS